MTMESAPLALSASLEDYLEAIFKVVQVKQAARAKDIGKRLKVSRSSVTGALHALADRDLINYTPYDLITLTAKGTAAAKDVVDRHDALRRFFIRVLAVDAGEADAAACKLEHAVPVIILDRLAMFVDYLEHCPRGDSDWIGDFRLYCERRERSMRSGCNSEKPSDNGTNDQERGASIATPMDATLATMRPGDIGTIKKITGAGGIRRRLLDMGVTAGTVVEVERIAPFGDPMEVKIKGYHLTLRKDEARRIVVTN